MKRLGFSLMAATALFAVSEGAANAVGIPSDTLQLFNAAGAPVSGAGFSKTEANEIACGGPQKLFDPKGFGGLEANGCLYSFNDSQAALAPADLTKEPFVSIVYEPDRTTVSDVFGIFCFSRASDTAPCTSGAFAFISDIEGQSIDISGIPESMIHERLYEGSGTPFDATYYLLSSALPTGYTATFFSDVADVPEPSTLALFAAGIIGLGAMRRRRKARAKA
jgi:hypothetical protein